MSDLETARIIKRGPQGETVYVNQFFTDRPGSNGTKHVYVFETTVKVGAETITVRGNAHFR